VYKRNIPFEMCGSTTIARRILGKVMPTFGELSHLMLKDPIIGSAFF
jgi:hypothetical protein